MNVDLRDEMARVTSKCEAEVRTLTAECDATIQTLTAENDRLTLEKTVVLGLVNEITNVSELLGEAMETASSEG